MNSLRHYSHQQITDEDVEAVVRALRSDLLTRGPFVEQFEGALAEFVGARRAVAVSSGTTALELVYRALPIRFVVTSALSFVATANAALVAGVRSVGFIDVDEMGLADVHSGCLFPSRCAYVPVHFAGRACPIPDMREMGSPVVVEDACHALGAFDHDGCSRVGSCAHSKAVVFSFHPVKSITTGEGGAVTTNDESLADELCSLRDHGRQHGLMTRLGTNARMTEFQAALGLSQLQRCQENVERRAELVEEYGRLLDGHPRVRPPLFFEDQFDASALHLCDVHFQRPSDREKVRGALTRAGIGCQVHYQPIIPDHPYYVNRFGQQKFPRASLWAETELSLPLHSGMSIGDVGTVVEVVTRELE